MLVLNQDFHCLVPILEAFIESKIRNIEYLIKDFRKILLNDVVLFILNICGHTFLFNIPNQGVW